MSDPGARDVLGELGELLQLQSGTAATPRPPAPAPAGPATTAGGDEPQAEVTPAYATLADFVSDYLIHVVERKLATQANPGALRWCEQWWAHQEAVARLYALWRAWETLRLDPGTGQSVWWRDHLDPHLAQLTSETGTFHRCAPADNRDPAKHTLPPPIPVRAVPADVLACLPDLGDNTAPLT